MIGFLSGKIRYSGEHIVIIEAGGVGYEVFMGEAQNGLEVSERVVPLWIYTYVREDQITLYGFRELMGKKLFLLLITVNGVGPKLAMAILTQLQPRELLDAMTYGNVKALCKVSGVGRKVADRLILELKDKLGQVLDLYQPALEGSKEAYSVWQDLSAALSGLGFPETKVRNVIKLARQNYAGQTADINILLKFALKKIKDC